MLSLMDLAAIDDFADVEAVLEQVGERTDTPALGLDRLPVRWSCPASVDGLRVRTA